MGRMEGEMQKQLTFQELYWCWQYCYSETGVAYESLWNILMLPSCVLRTRIPGVEERRYTCNLDQVVKHFRTEFKLKAPL